MTRMNEYQRGVLAAGAIVLLSVTLNAPTVQIHQGTIYRSGSLADTVATVIDWHTTLTYGFATLYRFHLISIHYAEVRSCFDKLSTNGFSFWDSPWPFALSLSKGAQ